MASTSIYDTLNTHLSGTTLTLPANAFGSGGIQDVLTTYFANGQLDLTGVTLTKDGEAVTIKGATCSGAPLAGLTVDADFSPSGQDTVLTLTATLASDWTFATGWPVLANLWISKITVANGTLTLTSVAAGSLKKGLNFKGDLTLSDDWQTILWLLGDNGVASMAGAIGQSHAVPDFSLSLTLAEQTLPVLGKLALDLVVACKPVLTTPQPLSVSGGSQAASPYYSPKTSLDLASTIPLAGVQLPITMDITAPSGGVPITANTTQLSEVAFSDFATMLPGIDFAGSLPSDGFDPGSNFALKSLTFLLMPKTKKITTVAIDLGTTAPWPVYSQITIDQIDIVFTVNVEKSSVIATLDGLFEVGGGDIALSATAPKFSVSGGLVEGTTIDLVPFVQNFIPSFGLDGTTLVLNELNFGGQTDPKSFQLTTGLTGDWSVPIGFTTLTLTEAYLSLDYESSKTSGTIGANGDLDLGGGAGDATFSTRWTLPGDFQLKGNIEKLDLGKLAQEITHTQIISGVTVTFDNIDVAITLNTTSELYEFSFSGSAAVNETTVGAAYFDLRKAQGTYGVITGLVVTEKWSPGDLWSGLNGILNDITIDDEGVIVSTMKGSNSVNLPDIKLPALPASVDEGFTFFASLELTGDIVGPVSKLFNDDIKLDLLLVIDEGDPSKSEFKATLPGSPSTNALAFKELGLTIQEGPPITATIDIQATLNVHGESIGLEGDGTITVGPAPKLTVTIQIEHWKDPFGITGLTIDSFGLGITVDEIGLTIMLEGQFEVGHNGDSIIFEIAGSIVDFEEPDFFLFELKDGQGQELTLGDLISTFTDLDLSDVPILDDIGFKEIAFWVVADPAGATVTTDGKSATFPQGIGIIADIDIFSWEADFNIEVEFSKGIIASGSISKPITLLDVFTLSAADDASKGPSGSIDTTQLAALQRANRIALANGTPLLTLESWAADGSPPYFTLDGKVEVLGLTESVNAKAAKSSFDFDIETKFLDIYGYTLNCHLIDDKNFTAGADIDFNLDVTLGPLKVDGITLIPKVHIDGPKADLGASITVGSDVSLSMHLTFEWGGLPKFDLHFTLDLGDIASDLSKLGSAILSWLENNVKKVFADILSDVSKWIDAIKNALGELADDIDNVANALANYFETGAEDAAQYLKDIGAEFDQIVSALTSFFHKTYDEAVTIVEDLVQDCAMASANAAASETGADHPSLRDMRFMLTGTEEGRQLLYLRYGYGDEIWRLLAHHPTIRARLAALERSPEGGRDLQLVLQTSILALIAVAHRASPGLREQIRVAIPVLSRYRRLSREALMDSLKNE
ncbi:MAG: hypothetical protein NXI16_05280 [Alphaproteobacteria bacterium]|nr:hypothetical protein [Alphaproteobacteria bacterium]